jgi:hypothetical protein
MCPLSYPRSSEWGMELEHGEAGGAQRYEAGTVTGQLGDS